MRSYGRGSAAHEQDYEEVRIETRRILGDGVACSLHDQYLYSDRIIVLKHCPQVRPYVFHIPSVHSYGNNLAALQNDYEEVGIGTAEGDGEFDSWLFTH